MLTGLHTIGRLGLAAVLALCVLACQQSPIHGDLGADDAPQRIPALVDAAGDADNDQLAAMIHALLDDDSAVRLFAIQSLYEQTGETLGYHYYGPVEERGAAAKRWRDWLASDSSAPPTSPRQAQANEPSPASPSHSPQGPPTTHD